MALMGDWFVSFPELAYVILALRGYAIRCISQVIWLYKKIICLLNYKLIRENLLYNLIDILYFIYTLL